ncbi:IclR family transcriptional regulator [Mangrovactinospora gilvigrisea]|uniref:IclR family transcriptional regulator n=1 Tax=Mangrovactinospora gilvigrisea TaxID=1428644 RepID=A0A1J7BC00_9ACTN|nr:IclR family transcriptional regulator [Mangrovactinospora gilvigrisea]OIV36223.1 IclR family transcriptional regulator [Mangrovactinospora gilvigrisea]
MGNVPAVGRAVAVLRLLAGRLGPMPAAVIARELGLPRSTTYHLLDELEAEGCVVHLPEERAYALGVTVFELGSAYLRADPLERVGRPLLARLVDDLRLTGHLGVLHGAETLYLVKEQARYGPSLVTDAGVRLPAQLTASGRAIMARLPRGQVRALFPSAEAFVDRTGRGPRTPGELRRMLDEERVRGWSEEDGFVTEGVASVAAAAVGREGRPVAAFSVSFGTGEVPAGSARAGVARMVRVAADQLTRRLGGTPR